jgi:ariadne-1
MVPTPHRANNLPEALDFWDSPPVPSHLIPAKHPIPLFPKPSRRLLYARQTLEPFVCSICCNDAPGLQTLSLDCEHAYHSVCWSDYVNSKVKDESEHTIRCMAEVCALVAPDNFIQSMPVIDPSAPVGDPQAEEQNLKTWTRFGEYYLLDLILLGRG